MMRILIGCKVRDIVPAERSIIVDALTILKDSISAHMQSVKSSMALKGP